MTSEHKFETLLYLYGSLNIQKSIIFCNSKEVVEYLCDQLARASFKVSAMHSGLRQSEREEVMEQ